MNDSIKKLYPKTFFKELILRKASSFNYFIYFLQNFRFLSYNKKSIFFMQK
jgi:hypothetical protein